jgi:RNA polymerase sigma factor (sigma-70 family)
MMQPGTYVELENGLHGIFTGYRGDGKARVICDASGMPEIHSVEKGEFYDADGRPSDKLLQFYNFFSIVSSQMGQEDEGLSKALIPGIGVIRYILHKAGRPGLTPIKVFAKHPKTGKMYETTRWVKSGQESKAAERSKGRKEKEEKETRVKTGGEYHDFLRPKPEQYKAIQNGDSDALAKYMFERFWKGPQTEGRKTRDGVGTRGEKKEGSVTDTSKFAQLFTRGRIEGYDLEDLIQEASIVMLMKQADGALKNVPEEKFPAYIATTFKFMGQNLRKRSRIDKQVADSIEEFSNYIQDYSQNQEAETVRQEHEQKIGEISQKAIAGAMDRFSGNKRAQDVFQRYLNGQKLSKISADTGVSLGNAKVIASRGMTAIGEIVGKAGYKAGTSGAKDWLADYRRIEGIQREQRARTPDGEKTEPEKKEPGKVLPSEEKGDIQERASEPKGVEKMDNDKIIKTLTAIGGKEWKSDDGSKHRIYFAERLIADKMAALQGLVPIRDRKYGDIYQDPGSGYKYYGAALKRLISPAQKVWYDFDDGKMYTERGGNNKELHAVINDIRGSIGE